jgi:hypothetical protein
MTATDSRHDVRPAKRTEAALKNMLRRLLGKIDFDRLCPGMKVGAVDHDILQLVVPADGFSTDLMLRHADDLAVAGEYALRRPIRKVDVLTAG